MNCPICNADLRMDEIEITVEGVTVKAYYALCVDGLIGEDPNWGGGYPCEFYIIKETQEGLLREIERSRIPF